MSYKIELSIASQKSIDLANDLKGLIVSADPNVVDNYQYSDIAIRILYAKCEELLSSLKSTNDLIINHPLGYKE